MTISEISGYKIHREREKERQINNKMFYISTGEFGINGDWRSRWEFCMRLGCMGHAIILYITE